MQLKEKGGDTTQKTRRVGKLPGF